jgi:hypothetical protein
VQLIAFLVLAAIASAKGTPECQYLYTDEQSRQLLVSDGGHTRPILEDPNGVHLPRWSPDGQSVAYVTDFRDYPNDVVAFVVVRNLTTLAAKRLPLNIDEHVIEVRQLAWKGPDKVWIEGRFGPRSGTYIEWDVPQGARTKELLGREFSYSATGTLAYVDHDPAPVSDAPSILVVGDRPIFETNSKIRALGWAPDGQSVGIIEDTGNGQRVRIVSREGKALQTSAPLAIVPEALTWISATRVEVRNGSDIFEMNTLTGTLKRVSGTNTRGLAAHDIVEQKENGRMRKLIAVDVRCGVQGQ